MIFTPSREIDKLVWHVGHDGYPLHRDPVPWSLWRMMHVLQDYFGRTATNHRPDRGFKEV